MKVSSLARAAALAACTLVPSMLTPAVVASTIGSITITNSNHYGYYGFSSTSAQNTKRAFSGGPFNNPINGIARVIRVNGTLTKVQADAWASSIQVQPSGGGMAIYQPSWQFSTQRDFNTLNVSATIYAPRGFNAAQTINLEMFSLDSEEFVPGLDARSTLTYTFDDAFAPGSVEFSGALTTSDPTFNRPIQYTFTDGFGNPLVQPPELTGAFPYFDAQPFHVATAGRYDLVSANEFESSMVLYGNSFDPSKSLQNVLAAVNQSENVVRNRELNDLPYLDDAVGASTISADLVPGVQYYMVTTAFNAPGVEADGGPFVGRYNNLITGAGAVTLGVVPEPTTLLAAGAAVSLVARRRR